MAVALNGIKRTMMKWVSEKALVLLQTLEWHLPAALISILPTGLRKRLRKWQWFGKVEIIIFVV